jgi:hypothetical protein
MKAKVKHPSPTGSSLNGNKVGAAKRSGSSRRQLMHHHTESK